MLFDKFSARSLQLSNRIVMVAFGRPLLANPDLVARMREGTPLNAPDPATFYVPGPKGYTDYPALGGAAA